MVKCSALTESTSLFFENSTTLGIKIPFTFFFLLFVLFPEYLLSQEILFHGHSHNDYTRKRPLFDALEYGFFSIEVDLFHREGAFIVAHTKAGIRRKNTFEKMYLKPLSERVKANNGLVYQNGPPEFEIMLDLKRFWSIEMVDSLSRLLHQYKEIFTLFINDEKITGAVRVLLSGGATKYQIAAFNPRYFSVDGGLGDIKNELSPEIIPRVSAKYGNQFQWRGQGKMPDHERQKLWELVAHAHAHQRKIRFWGACNHPKVWKELLDAGVDWINVDRLKKFRKFYLDEYSGN